MFVCTYLLRHEPGQAAQGRLQDPLLLVQEGLLVAGPDDASEVRK